MWNNLNFMRRGGHGSSRLANQSGQSLLEIALLLPFLLLLTIGIIEVGRYAYISVLVGNAARPERPMGHKASRSPSIRQASPRLRPTIFRAMVIPVSSSPPPRVTPANVTASGL